MSDFLGYRSAASQLKKDKIKSGYTIVGHSVVLTEINYFSDIKSSTYLVELMFSSQLSTLQILDD